MDITDLALALITERGAKCQMLSRGGSELRARTLASVVLEH